MNMIKSVLEPHYLPQLWDYFGATFVVVVVVVVVVVGD